MTPFNVIFFDLDGTLVDTAPDLAYALNNLLVEEGHAPLPFKQIRPVASNGSAGLLGLGFGITPDHTEYRPLQQRFLQLYQDNIARESGLFEGMEQVIHQLEQADISWGVITNKPAFLTAPLLAALNLTDRAACIVSGDTTPYSKPHPAPMLHACALINAEPQQCVYVGDAKRDIEAGKNANMRTVLARYGYLSQNDHPESWHADSIIDHPNEILQWI